jgi:hypothetical protein
VPASALLIGASSFGRHAGVEQELQSTAKSCPTVHGTDVALALELEVPMQLGDLKFGLMSADENEMRQP